jgi:hypothetical protein
VAASAATAAAGSRSIVRGRGSAAASCPPVWADVPGAGGSAGVVPRKVWEGGRAALRKPLRRRDLMRGGADGGVNVMGAETWGAGVGDRATGGGESAERPPRDGDGGRWWLSLLPEEFFGVKPKENRLEDLCGGRHRSGSLN